MHYIYPPKFYITFVFYFSLVLHFGGQIICVVGDVQAEYEIDVSPPGSAGYFFLSSGPSPSPYHVHVSYYWFRAGCQAGLAWVSGISGGKGERWKQKRERAEGEKRLTQMLLLEPSTPTQHDSIPSNQNHIRSLSCQLHVSKSSPEINLTVRSCRAPVLVLQRFRFFLKPSMKSFRILVMENLPFSRNYNML